MSKFYLLLEVDREVPKNKHEVSELARELAKRLRSTAWSYNTSIIKMDPDSFDLSQIEEVIYRPIQSS